jgi:hypothetical protein
MALAIVLISNSGYALETGKGSVWNLTQDIGISSNQISFNQNSNGVWFFMQSASVAQVEYSYSLLSGYTTPCTEFGMAGLLCWYPSLPYSYETGFPFIGFNTTQTTQYPATLTWPARTVVMHPAPDKLAIIGWKSPLSGKVDLSGWFSDFDAVCGNGVRWYIHKGNTSLSSGNLLNGGNGRFLLRKVNVNPGDVLYFIVGPKDGDYLCDSTGFDLTIKSLN